ncbi:MAG: DEAD/DEAH box helicase family protein, partial [Solobacterium sp.]|nr:DEAD/DEAH box helicase family protein [Solobacterium sp.]
MERFELVSPFHPTGDQPQAIDELVKGLEEGKKEQVLEGATGTGKTFTMANIIERVNRPTLVFSHNKTLAGQLYSEFKELFPHNRVEFFVSNFDYYQPEAYMPKNDMYIEKTAAINEELDMFRESTLNSLLERHDTIVVASVACIYAASDPMQYKDMFFTIRVGETYDRNALLRKFVDLQYRRNDVDQTRGTLRVRGDVIDVTPSYTDQFNIRIEMFGDEIERITEIDPVTGHTQNAYQFYNVFPASGYARSHDQMLRACDAIEAELEERLAFFKQNEKPLEAERLEQRTRFDLEALRENGYCAGIENYSMHIDGRVPGQRPWNLFDYFPKDMLLIVDESHVSLPQIRGMYNGDRQRKETLVEYGFRLPSALENRPMRFDEFESIAPQVIYCSATPGDYELEHVNHEVVEQIIRPTGLLD